MDSEQMSMMDRPGSVSREGGSARDVADCGPRAAFASELASDAERGTLDGSSASPSLTARISGFNRLPRQASQNCGLMNALRRFLVNSLSLSAKRRCRLGTTPSKGWLLALILPARQKVNWICVSPEPQSRMRLKSSGRVLYG